MVFVWKENVERRGKRVGDGAMFQFLLTSLLHADGIWNEFHEVSDSMRTEYHFHKQSEKDPTILVGKSSFLNRCPLWCSNVDATHEVDCCIDYIKWIKLWDTWGHGSWNLHSWALFLLGVTRLMDVVYRLVPLPVVRGVQLSQGLSFATTIVKCIRNLGKSRTFPSLSLVREHGPCWTSKCNASYTQAHVHNSILHGHLS